MIMLTVTKPRRKLKKFLKGGALLLLLGVVVPGIYYSLQTVGAMSLFASSDAVVSGEQQEQVEQPEQPEQTQQTQQTEMILPTEQTEQPEQSGQTELTEQTAAEENAVLENDINGGAADNINEENITETKPGILARLRAVIFGEKAEVTPY